MLHIIQTLLSERVTNFKLEEEEEQEEENWQLSSSVLLFAP